MKSPNFIFLRFKIIAAIIICLIFLNACDYVRFKPASTSVPTPTSSPIPEQCAWVWASKSLPEVTSNLLNIFNNSEISDIEIHASGFGVNCSNSAGSVQSFGMLCIDLSLKANVTSLDDPAYLGNILRPALVILKNLPPDTLPRTVCQITIHLVGRENDKWFSTSMEILAHAIDSGSTGVEFFKSLTSN